MITAILVIFSIVLVSLAAYAFACWGGQRKLAQDCQRVGERLRAAEKNILQLVSLRRSFDTYCDEPFATSLLDIDANLETIKQDLNNHFQRYVQMREELSHLESLPWWKVRLRWNWIYLRRFQKRCTESLVNCQAVEGRVEQLRTRFDQIREFPWSIALQAREMIEYLQQAKLLLNELTRFGLHGEAFNLLVDQLKEVEETTKLIPVYFLSDPYEKLVNEASQADVRDVYQIVQGLPKVVVAIQQADRWKNQVLALEKQGEIAQKELERLTQLLSSLSDEIDLRAERARIEEWQALLGGLKKEQQNIEVERLTTLANKFSDLTHQVQTDQQYLRQLRQRLYQYRRLMQSSADVIAQIQRCHDAIGQSSLKVEWDVSGKPFRQALDAYQALQSIEKPYSPQDLEKLVKESSELHSTLLDVNRQTGQIESLHSFCGKMLASVEIENAPQWIDAAKKLAESIRPYDPRNWPNREWVLSFDKRLQEVETNYRYLMEKLAKRLVLESSMEETARLLDEVYRQSVSFRERMSVIEQVFRNLVNHEQHSVSLLKTARNQFAQMTMFVLSQPLLADKAEREIVQLDRKFDLCEASFQQREKDTLAHKQTKLQQLISDVEQAANRWMSIVESDCLKILNDLEKRIEHINRIGHFEDALLFRAQEVLARRNEIFNFRRTARVNIPIDQLVGAMKKVFDTWQESFAVSKQIAEQVEDPLLSVYQEFQTLQSNVQKKFLELEKLIPSQRKWPPNSLLLTVERNEMWQLEEKWRSLQNQPISIIQFVKILSEMSGNYRTLLEKFKQYEQWAIQEGSRIERIEADIYRLDRLWEIQQRRYGQVPEIEGQIRDIRQKAAQEIASLRQYWLTNVSRRPPSVDYDVVLRKLIELSRHLANAKVIFINEQGQQETMDINGQVIQKT